MNVNPKALELMNMRLEDAKKPEPVPQGLYKAVVIDCVAEKSRVKETPYVKLVWELHEAVNVQENSLESYERKWGRIRGAKVWDTYWLTQRAVPRLTQTLSNLGFDGKSLNAALNSIVGTKSVLRVKHDYDNKAREFRAAVAGAYRERQ